jgi:oligopeptidase B
MKLQTLMPLLTLIVFSCNNSKEVKKETFKWPEGIHSPVAEKKPYKMEAHGDVRIDDYYWMNDFFKKGPDSAKVVDYLKAENAFLDTMFAGSKKFREDLFNELKGRIKEKDESVPFKDNGYWYYTRFEEGKDYPVYCRKKESLDAKEEVMHDANKAAEGKGYYSAAGLEVSDSKI